MYAVLAVCIAVSSVIGVTLAFIGTLSTKVNLKNLSDQVRRLTLANNVDRAVRLCSSGHQLVACRAMKALLVRAHRPHEMNLVYHEQLVALRAFGVGATARHTIASVLQLGSFALLLAILYIGEGGSTLVQWCIGTIVVASLIGNVIGANLRAHLRAIPAHLLELRNLLCGQAGYVPPENRSMREMTADEVAAWRRSMDTLTKEVVDRKGRGEAVDIAAVHDERMEPDGVLPRI
ncbi:MAG: hypothetical protein Q8R16_05420 [bacterium]|nr:hypothetical protein [bacterium]